MQLSRGWLLLFVCLCAMSVRSQETSTSAKAPDGTLEHPYKVGGAVSPPRVISAEEPHYSNEARKKHVEGTVVLWLVVDIDGHAKNIKVAFALGNGLDAAAVTAVSKWKFAPSMKDGQPVAVQVNVSINFRLDR